MRSRGAPSNDASNYTTSNPTTRTMAMVLLIRTAVIASCSLTLTSAFSSSIRPTCRTFRQSTPHHATASNVDIIGTVALLVPSSSTELSKYGSKSPAPRPSYQEAAEHLARKISHFSDGRIEAVVVTPSTNQDDTDDVCLTSNALIALGITDPAEVQYLSTTFRKRRTSHQETSSYNTCQFALDCGSNNYAPLVGPWDEANPSILAEIAPWTGVASGKRLTEQMNGLFEKQTSDEFALAVMLFFNRFSGTAIPWVQHSIDVTWEKGLVQNAKEIFSMITKCGPCITKCLNDENCSQCINGKWFY